MRTFKVLGLLLTYPTDELVAALPEIRKCLDEEQLLPPRERVPLDELLTHLASTDIWTLREDYVALFDRSRAMSLHLYEHVHGESRDRGQAMARLAATYRVHGFAIDAAELPDFLPLICEFLSMVDLKAARTILADASAVLEALRVRLTQRRSPYAGALAALTVLAAQSVDPALLAEILAGHDKEDDSLETVDRLWEEAPVTFGPDGFGAKVAGAGCSGGRNQTTSRGTP